MKPIEWKKITARDQNIDHKQGIGHGFEPRLIFRDGFHDFQPVRQIRGIQETHKNRRCSYAQIGMNHQPVHKTKKCGHGYRYHEKKKTQQQHFSVGEYPAQNKQDEHTDHHQDHINQAEYCRV